MDNKILIDRDKLLSFLEVGICAYIEQLNEHKTDKNMFLATTGSIDALNSVIEFISDDEYIECLK